MSFNRRQLEGANLCRLGVAVQAKTVGAAGYPMPRLLPVGGRKGLRPSTYIGSIISYRETRFIMSLAKLLLDELI